MPVGGIQIGSGGGGGGGGGGGAAEVVSQALSATVLGTSYQLIGSVYLLAGTILAASSRAMLGTDQVADTADLELRRFTGGAVISTISATGVLQNAAPGADAENAMRMFCGDKGYRPCDSSGNPASRVSDPDRWFWEELPIHGREEWEQLFKQQQRTVSTVLLQKAYPNDPYAPSYLLHQTVRYTDVKDCPVAIFSIDELLDYTCRVKGFHTRPYKIHKGRFKHDPNEHLAPRFGYIQFQRAGNKQHPTQLQFNLQAGYFNKLPT